MPRAASVWLDVLPSMAEFRRQLRRELEDPVRQSAQRAGDEGGEGLMKSMGKKMAAGAAVAGAAVGALVVKGIALEMEKAAASGKLKASLGLSPQEAKKAGDAAGRLYTNGVTGSIEEGADAVKAIMSAGIAPPKATTKQLAAIATKVQDLSSTFELDLGQTSNAVGQILKTGLAKDGGEALDVLFRGMQKLGPRADDIADTYNEYSTIFRSLGLNVKTTMGLFSQGMRNGARDTDVIADALKEFQIRATDGSTSSAAGFKSLGLNAKDMTAQISRGGKGASDGLQLVLDKLRGMKDPVKRNAAAVALFGTKAEDMAQALYSLDPSKAVNELGKVGGAAKQAGNDLRKDAGTQFEIFKRRFLMSLGDAAAKYAIPALMRTGRVLNRDVLPPVKSVAGWLAKYLGPAIIGVAKAIAGGAGWLRKYGAWLAPLAVIVAGLTLALNANAIATALAMGVMGAYSIAVRGVAAVTRVWAAAQALMNAVMALNPFVLIAIAVVALGVAMVVAYKKSDTFRAIVQGAWEGIQAAAMWAWEKVLKPVFAGLVAAWKAVAAGALWLWNTALKPVFGFLSTAARIVAAIYVTVLLVAFKVWWTGVKYYFSAVAAIAMWLWKTVLSPVISSIIGGFQLWWAGVKLYFSLVMSGFRAVGAAATWLWTAAISPVIGWIVAGAQLLWAGVNAVFGYLMLGLRTVGGWFKWLYNSAVKPVVGWVRAGAVLMWAGVNAVFGYLKLGLKTTGGWFTWLWRKAVSPALSGVKSVISTVYHSGIKPVLDALRSAIGRVGDAFESGQKAIGRAWGKVEGIAKKPIAFIINTVYNKGIVGTWNKVAKAFGAPTLSEFHPKGFARGGVLAGQSSYRQGDDQLVPMRRGEGVYVSEAMRDPYERARLHAVNAAAMRGQSLNQFQGGFAKGGIFGWVGSAASKVGDLAKSGVSWLKDGIKASAVAGLNSVVKPLISKISGSASLYRDMVTKIPERIIKSIVGYSGKADKKMEAAGIGGGGFKKGLSWARTQAGKAYQWGGNGNPSWDCSGLVSAIESVIRGQTPHRRWATGAFSGATAPPGWVLNKRSPYMIGITNHGVGHTAGTLNGVNVESRGGDGVVIGSRARSWKDGLFTHHYGFAAKGYASGGKPRAGELAWVGERGPELVRFGTGSAEVYNHADSMRMWEGMGARGFAKGTTSAKARKDLPGDVTAFTKSLTGSAADISKAAKELTKDLKAAGVGGKSLTNSVTKASAKLQTMAKQRDAIAGKIAAAKTTASDQAKAASDYLGLGNLSDATSINDVISGLQARQSTVKSFQSQIKTLSRKGLSQDLISQLVAMGPDSTLAGMVAGASAGQIKQLNALAKSGAKLSTTFGRSMADSMFDAGKAASQGFLTGLMAQEKDIQTAMAKVGAGAVKSLRSKKGIDAHSPSRKGARAGADLGAGLVAGMAAAGPSVKSAAARLGAAAVPAGVVPVTSGASAPAAPSGLDGRPVLLVVEDDVVLRAYVSDRVGDALTDVRRSKRSGRKQG